MVKGFIHRASRRVSQCILVLLAVLTVSSEPGEKRLRPDPADIPGTSQWWAAKKAAASEKAGRRVWAWELTPPPDHPCYINKSEPEPPAIRWKEGFQDMHKMDLVPRPEMPNWFCPTPCGTLNLSHPYTKHCFPPDGSKHHVCCTAIQLPDPGDDFDFDNGLAAKIRAASHPGSYSWCTCSRWICEELLGGKVSWDAHALTRNRWVHEQITVGFDVSGWEWLTGGIPELFQLGNTICPENDPYDDNFESRTTLYGQRAPPMSHERYRQEEADTYEEPPDPTSTTSDTSMKEPLAKGTDTTGGRTLFRQASPEPFQDEESPSIHGRTDTGTGAEEHVHQGGFVEDKSAHAARTEAGGEAVPGEGWRADGAVEAKSEKTAMEKLAEFERSLQSDEDEVDGGEEGGGGDGREEGEEDEILGDLGEADADEESDESL